MKRGATSKRCYTAERSEGTPLRPPLSDQRDIPIYYAATLSTRYHQLFGIPQTFLCVKNCLRIPVSS